MFCKKVVHVLQWKGKDKIERWTQFLGNWILITSCTTAGGHYITDFVTVLLQVCKNCSGKLRRTIKLCKNSWGGIKMKLEIESNLLGT
jgi:hypothetical protein